MKAYNVIRELSKLPADEHIIINWWEHEEIAERGGSEELTPNEWKHLTNRINGKAEWSYILDSAIEESHNIVARREDLFKDKSG